MFRRPLSVFPLIAVSLAIVIFPRLTRASSMTFIGEKIPKRLSVGSPYIFAGSDSLYLNGRLLMPDSAYSFRTGEGYFDLSGINAGPSDTLRVTYKALPPWLAKTYGRPLPEVSTAGERPPMPEAVGDTAGTRRGGEVQISGAKSFRVTSRTAGGSEFNQSLDLNITGELTPGLYISGAITDRGYNPAYGTANSRLNELDKINIKLRSQRLEAQIGDITFADFTTAKRDKDVSGASFMLPVR